MTFYDVREDALSFVMPALIQWVPIAHFVIGLLLSIWTVAFLIRIVLSWYPEVSLSKGFWSLAALLTEPILSFTRRFVAPIGGVDVTPVIWVGLVSLLRELLVGQQGLLSQVMFNSQVVG